MESPNQTQDELYLVFGGCSIDYACRGLYRLRGQLGGDMRAWIALAFGDDETPYSDEPGIAYAFDDRVQNHKQVRTRDLLFLRNRDRLEGVGRIKRIEEGVAQKSFPRCPTCGTGRIHRRLRVKPAYKCSNGHLFDEPTVSRTPVKTFRAYFDGDFLNITRRISPAELRPFQLRDSTQLAIMPADLDGLVQHVIRRAPGVETRLLEWANVSRVSIADQDADERPILTPDGVDSRSRSMRAILVRRGQQEFRRKLIDRYGAKCTISGCRVLGVLEAAHIRPYRGSGDNHPANGLLLRSDLHTLFDLDRIGIHPDTLTVAIPAELEGTEYESFKGNSLLIDQTCLPDPQALLSRWQAFIGTASTSNVESEAPS
jgi:hypothetical protein